MRNKCGSFFSTGERINNYGTSSKVSTITSKNAFSTGERILDPFHSSLTARIVEVFICTQNWLKETPSMERFYMEDVEEYNKLDKDNQSLNEVVHSFLSLSLSAGEVLNRPSCISNRFLLLCIFLESLAISLL